MSPLCPILPKVVELLSTLCPFSTRALELLSSLLTRVLQLCTVFISTLYSLCPTLSKVSELMSSLCPILIRVLEMASDRFCKYDSEIPICAIYQGKAPASCVRGRNPDITRPSHCT